jgi:hypothetical protein
MQGGALETPTAVGRRVGMKLRSLLDPGLLEVDCCASRLSVHEGLCARLGNPQDEQAGNCCRAGVVGPFGKVVVRDGEDSGVGDLAQTVCG